MRGRRGQSSGCDIDMTPMIDVVFQLIIFFLVAVNLENRSNPEIQLEKGPNGERIGKNDPNLATLTVEIDRRGKVSVNNLSMDHTMLRHVVTARYNRLRGPYPLLIRGDLRTNHADVRKVMDICTKTGLRSVRFAAIKEDRP